MELQGLDSVDIAFCELLWQMESMDEVKRFVDGLPFRLQSKAQTIVELMVLSSIDKSIDTNIADKLMKGIKSKPN